MENTGLFNAEGKALSIADVMAMLPTAMITRVEVIDEKGRSYVNWKPTNRIELQVQDNGRTLKVFCVARQLAITCRKCGTAGGVKIMPYPNDKRYFEIMM